MRYEKESLSSLEKCVDKEFCISNAQGSYSSTTLAGMNTKPYHGLFVKDLLDKKTGNSVNNLKVIVSNVIETLSIGSNQHKLYSLRVKNNIIDGTKYIKKFEKKYLPRWEYAVENVFISKTITFIHKEDILYLEYLIENRSEHNINLRLEPLLTYRSIDTVKTKDRMNFTQREIEDGVKVNLSIASDESVYIKSSDVRFRPEHKYIEGIQYMYAKEKGENEDFAGDVYIPGQFDVKVKASDKKIVRIAMGSVDLSLENIDRISYVDLENQRIERFVTGIEKYPEEMKALAISAHELEFRNKKSWRKLLLNGLPNTSNDICTILRSLEGNFLVVKQAHQARDILKSTSSCMKDGIVECNLMRNQLQTSFDKVEASLWYVEAINRFLQYTDNIDLDIMFFKPIVKQIVYRLLDSNSDEINFDDDYLLKVKGRDEANKYIHINALLYNALKVYLDMMGEKNLEFDKILRIANLIRQSIIDNFWSEFDKKMKYEVNGDPREARIDMIYCLSLSYPVLHDKLANKLLDTIFKEYYTAYGMRKYIKGSESYDGNIYPSYMGHFIKANLRQNGITRATQKITYNLVKELAHQVSSCCIGALPHKYSEDEVQDYGCLMHGESIAEMIRIFDMLQ
ncbi:MAG: glycogen debranching enzyme N-terminal domain-containing protein [Clostridia bacterium]